MTDKELISRIQSLKQIKPRENWVLFTKSKILNNNFEAEKSVGANNVNFIGNMFKTVFLSKFTYSLAVLLFVISVGSFFAINGILNNGSNVKVSKSSTASILAIKDSVEDFKIKSKSLSDTVKYSPESTSLVVKEVKEAARELTVAIKNDPDLAKEVALDINNNKTYLEFSEANDLKEVSNNLYKTIVDQMIKDIEDTTLTESQEESLNIVKNSYKENDYTSALEDILLLNIAIDQNN